MHPAAPKGVEHTMKWRVVSSFLAVLVLGVLGGSPRSAQEVVVYTSEAQMFSEPILKAFEAHTGITVQAVYDIEETTSTGVVNRLIAEQHHPQADVFWSNDPVRPILLHKQGMFTPYQSVNRARIPQQYRDAEGYWTGFAARARVIVYNRRLVAPPDAPQTIRDMIIPAWHGKVAFANPLFGTATMHVAALFATWSEEYARGFFLQMQHNAVRIATSNGEVRDLVAAGEVAWGVTDTDEAHMARTQQKPVEVVYPDQDGLGTLIMPNMVVMIKGGPHPENAKKLIDYLLSADVEAQLAASPAAQMPLGADVTPPQGVPTVASLKGMAVDYVQVADRLEQLQPFLSTWVGYR
jgi:iron(III) transport system substrate-binding protein